MFLGIRSAILGIALALLATQAAPAESPAIAAIRDKVKAYRDSITDLDYSFHTQTTLLERSVPHMFENVVPDSFTRVMWRGKLFRTEETHSTPSGQSKTITSYDGNEVRILRIFPSQTTGKIKPQNVDGEGVANYIGTSQMWPADLEPRNTRDLLQTLASLDQGQIEEEAIFDQTCTVVTSQGGGLKVWLDFAHGAIVRRAVVSNGHGQNYFDFSVPKVMEQNGIWFPAEAEQVVYGYTGGPPELLGKPILKSVYTVEKIAINTGLQAATLLVQFPPGIPITREDEYTSESTRKLLLDVAPVAVVLLLLTLTLWIFLRWKSRRTHAARN